MSIDHQLARAIHRASKRAQYYDFDDLHSEERQELLTEAVQLRQAMADEGLAYPALATAYIETRSALVALCDAHRGSAHALDGPVWPALGNAEAILSRNPPIDSTEAPA